MNMEDTGPVAVAFALGEHHVTIGMAPCNTSAVAVAKELFEAYRARLPIVAICKDYAHLQKANCTIGMLDCCVLADVHYDMIAILQELGYDTSCNTFEHYTPHFTVAYDCETDCRAMPEMAVMLSEIQVLGECGCEPVWSSRADSLMALFGETVMPPKYMSILAGKGLKTRDQLPKSKQCCTRTGLARANQLKGREPLSLETLKRMQSYIQRAMGQAKPGDTLADSKNAQAMAMWGADQSGKALKWVERTIAKLEQA